MPGGRRAAVIARWGKLSVLEMVGKAHDVVESCN